MRHFYNAFFPIDGTYELRDIVDPREKKCKTVKMCPDQKGAVGIPSLRCCYHSESLSATTIPRFRESDAIIRESQAMPPVTRVGGTMQRPNIRWSSFLTRITRVHLFIRSARKYLGLVPCPCVDTWRCSGSYFPPPYLPLIVFIAGLLLRTMIGMMRS